MKFQHTVCLLALEIAPRPRQNFVSSSTPVWTPAFTLDFTDRHAIATQMLGADGIVMVTNYRGEHLGNGKVEPVLAELDRRSVEDFSPSDTTWPVMSEWPAVVSDA